MKSESKRKAHPVTGALFFWMHDRIKHLFRPGAFVGLLLFWILTSLNGIGMTNRAPGYFFLF